MMFMFFLQQLQQLFPYAALTDWSSSGAHRALWEVRTTTLYICIFVLVFKGLIQLSLTGVLVADFGRIRASNEAF